MPDSPTVFLTTLGCAKNEVDSQKLAARLRAAGYAPADAPDAADVVLVNTCAFIEPARRESIETILDHAERRRPGARLVVLGCMAQRYDTELAEALPEVDAVIRLDRYGELVARLDEVTGREPIRVRSDPMDILFDVRRPAPSAPYAYVKVAEGCDKPCTFCAIPQFRGRQRSRPPHNVRAEVAGLTAAGAGEVVLVAQDVAAYGRDIGSGIVELLGSLRGIDGLRRLRLLYLFPREVTPRLIDEIAGDPVVADYFDLSLQHASAPLLRAMKRPGDADRHLGLIDRIRAAAPEAAVRSSFIVGFPGETEDDVELLEEFLRAARLDWAGFFSFSPEAGTPAAAFPGAVDADEAAERLRRLHEAQEELTADANAAAVGRVVEVVVDQVEDGVALARSHREAPEIDGMVLLDRGAAGEWLQAKITASYGTDTQGEVVG